MTQATAKQRMSAPPPQGASDPNRRPRYAPGREPAAAPAVSGVFARQGARRRRVGSIERIVQWAFAEECVRFHDGFSRPRDTLDSLAVLERIAHVGCRIDVSPKPESQAHPDALLLAETLAEIATPTMFDIVARHGQTGTRPTIRADRRMRIEPQQWQTQRRNGKLWAKSQIHRRYTVLYRSRLVDRQEMSTPIRYVNRPDEIERERRRYNEWRSTLIRLRGMYRPHYWTLTRETPPEDP